MDMIVGVIMNILYRIDGIKYLCFNGWYVIHDGVKVKEVISPWIKEWRDKKRNRSNIQSSDKKDFMDWLKFKNR